MKGCEEFGHKVEYYLKQWMEYDESFIIETHCPRFTSGEGKGMILETIRGKDIFILLDTFNYSITYSMYGFQNHMSPDDHFQDVKRVLSAIGGKAKRITVIMPMLYEGRQHRKAFRESLDCAHALQELSAMGAANIITFDAHDPRVQNAVPLAGFDNIQPKYQMVKAMSREYEDVEFMSPNTVLISPDEGGMNRCLSYASSLDLDVGMFYKQRDVQNVDDGMNKIVKHVYIGDDLTGKDVIVVDDMISSGESLIDTLRRIDKMNVKRSFAFITFGMFTGGLRAFDEAWEQGVFEKIFVTNLIYNSPELLARPWVSIVDMSKYTAYIIDAIHRDDSIGAIIDPNMKIRALLEKSS
jgi:ribose-phosphate pyrophosphokinase